MSLKYILLSLGISLTLTLILELFFALIFKVRGKALLLTIFANILTNPAVVVLYLLFCRHYTFPEAVVISILEISAVVVEAVIYKTSGIKRPFLLSLGANAFSYLCGLLIGSLI